MPPTHLPTPPTHLAQSSTSPLTQRQSKLHRRSKLIEASSSPSDRFSKDRKTWNLGNPGRRRRTLMFEIEIGLRTGGVAVEVDTTINRSRVQIKEQKRKSSRFILAPIDASREILRSVYLSLNMILYFSLILWCYYYYFGLICLVFE